MVIFGNSVFTAIRDKFSGGTGIIITSLKTHTDLKNQIGSICYLSSSGETNQGEPDSASHPTATRIENGGLAIKSPSSLRHEYRSWFQGLGAIRAVYSSLQRVSGSQ